MRIDYIITMPIFSVTSKLQELINDCKKLLILAQHYLPNGV